MTARAGAWTPGPWVAGEIPDSTNIGYRHWIAPAPGFGFWTAAVCNGRSPEQDEEVAANARLISAAPTMAEALRDLLRDAEGSGWASVHAAKAALRKAGI